MRIYFLPRRLMAAVSILAVLIILAVAVHILHESEQVAAWVRLGA